VTVLNKVDALDETLTAEVKAGLREASGGAVLEMSGAAQLGTTEVLRALRTQIDEDRLRVKARGSPPLPQLPRDPAHLAGAGCCAHRE